MAYRYFYKPLAKSASKQRMGFYSDGYALHSAARQRNCSPSSKALEGALSNRTQNGISEIIVNLTVARKISLQLLKLFRLQSRLVPVQPDLFPFIYGCLGKELVCRGSDTLNKYKYEKNFYAKLLLACCTGGLKISSCSSFVFQKLFFRAVFQFRCDFTVL